jgi:hypothetical protein
VERPLNFRDIVRYIAVTGGLKADIAVVPDVIPANLQAP